MKNPLAFPKIGIETNAEGRTYSYDVAEGMTLRDYFAAKAMQGFASRWLDTGSSATFEMLVKDSYELADIMLAAREEKTNV